MKARGLTMTTCPSDLLSKLRAAGIEVRPHPEREGHVQFKLPPGGVPVEAKPLLAEAKRMRHLLAAFLRRPVHHPLCGHTEMWLSRYGVWVCMTCHPPAPGAAVWPEEAPPRHEAVPAKIPAQNAARDLWEYPVLGGIDPLDYRFNPATEEWEYRPGWWRELLTGPG